MSGEFAATGMSVIVSSHILSEVAQVADDIGSSYFPRGVRSLFSDVFTTSGVFSVIPAVSTVLPPFPLHPANAETIAAAANSTANTISIKMIYIITQ